MQEPKKMEKKKRVVIVNSHWSRGSTKTAEDTDKTAKETTPYLTGTVLVHSDSFLALHEQNQT